MLGKKADGGAAIVIIAIAILFVGYITLLPKEDRCKIIPDLPMCNATKNGVSANVLLSEKPGLLQPIEESTEYNIGTIELFNKEVTEIPFSLTANIVERSWFNNNKIEKEFTMPGRIMRTIVFVSVQEAGFGALSIVINGKTAGRVIGTGIHTVEVPPALIKHNNILGLIASPPLIPGNTNSFKINSIILKQVYTLTQPEITRNFVMEQDVGDVSSALLSFDADCYSTEPLIIQLNNKTIINEKICGRYPGNDVRSALERSNEIRFETEGNYYIHDAKLKVKFKQRDYISYYFTIGKDEYAKIDDGLVLVMLKLRFPDTSNKRVTIYLNGNPVSIDTSKVEYKTAIGKLLTKGQNSVKIVPETSVDLGQLDIYFE